MQIKTNPVQYTSVYGSLTDSVQKYWPRRVLSPHTMMLFIVQ